jgi:hypothetical protein
MLMNSFQVKFRCLPAPGNPEGVILNYERVGGLTHEQSPLAVTFRDTAELDSAFIAAGIYLHAYSHIDPERDARPDPEQNYEVTEDALRKIGFHIP